MAVFMGHSSKGKEEGKGDGKGRDGLELDESGWKVGSPF